MKHKKLLIAFSAILAAIALAYVWFNWPYWSEHRELNRIFTSSEISLSKNSELASSCELICPELDIGATSQPATYGGFTTALTIALSSHGYTITGQNFSKYDTAENLVTGYGGAFYCLGPGSISTGDQNWQCDFSAKNSKYRFSAQLEFSAVTKPMHDYTHGGNTITDMLPADARLLNANLSLASSK
jgi:hypothetical protein